MNQLQRTYKISKIFLSISVGLLFLALAIYTFTWYLWELGLIDRW